MPSFSRPPRRGHRRTVIEYAVRRGIYRRRHTMQEQFAPPRPRRYTGGGNMTEGVTMPSPFPGMDPYLEQHWGDIHHRLITYGCDQLRPQLPEDLRARIEERVFVESDEGDD